MMENKETNKFASWLRAKIIRWLGVATTEQLAMVNEIGKFRAIKLKSEVDANIQKQIFELEAIAYENLVELAGVLGYSVFERFDGDSFFAKTKPELKKKESKKPTTKKKSK